MSSFARKHTHEDIPAYTFESVFSRISGFCSFRERSALEVRKKLEALGVDSPLIDEAIAHAQDLGIIDDSRYADAFVRQKLSCGIGVVGIRNKLRQAGIDDECIDYALTRNYPEYSFDGEVDRALTYLSRHSTHAKNELEGNIRLLISHGFSYEVSECASKKRHIVLS